MNCEIQQTGSLPGYIKAILFWVMFAHLFHALSILKNYVLSTCHELPCVSRAFLNGRNLFSRFSSAPLCSNCSYTDKHLMVESKSMNECFMFCISSLYSRIDFPISCSVIFIFPMNCMRLSSLLIRLLISSMCLLIFS